MKAHLLIALASASLLVACSGKPSAGDAEDALLKKLRKDESSVEVESFKAGKAYAQEVLGTQMYIVEYEAEIVYPKGLNAHCKQSILAEGCAQAMAFGKIADVGAVQKRKGEVAFEKTSEGWKGPDGNFY